MTRSLDEIAPGPPCRECGGSTLLDDAVDPESGDICDDCYMAWLVGVPRGTRTKPRAATDSEDAR